MDITAYEQMPMTRLRHLAKQRGLVVQPATKKTEIIERLLAHPEVEIPQPTEPVVKRGRGRPPKNPKPVETPLPEVVVSVEAIVPAEVVVPVEAISPVESTAPIEVQQIPIIIEEKPPELPKPRTWQRPTPMLPSTPAPVPVPPLLPVAEVEVVEKIPAASVYPSFAEKPAFRAAYVPRDERNRPREALPELELSEVRGILEMQPDGFGLLRTKNLQPGSEDVYVSIPQIRRYRLQNGDELLCKTRPARDNVRFSALFELLQINGLTPEQAFKRKAFDELVPIYPEHRITLENQKNLRDLAIRVIDFIAPIGFGQRALIVSPPKAGKTVLLKKIANAICQNFPEAHLMVLLIDERPEEVTDIQRSVKGEVVYSTFDEMPESHTRVSELAIDRAQRLVESGRDVIILLDSITRLARAYNAAAPQTGRAMSGGLAPGILQKPKRFFGAARNIENGGSLTIIATALIETGSRMDDVIYEEFKGTGNMEIHLDRKLSEKRIFPAIDLAKSGTRHEELLLSAEEYDGANTVRKLLSSTNSADAVEQLMGMLEKTRNNKEFFARLKDWMAIWEKEGYTVGSMRRNSGMM